MTASEEVRSFEEVVADMPEEPEITFDEEMRLADVDALKALMDDRDFMARCSECSSSERYERMQQEYLTLSSRDIGKLVESVVTLYGNHRLRPVVIQESASNKSLPASAACWSLKTLLQYCVHTVTKSLLEQAMQCLAQADFPAAREHLSQAIHVSPASVEAWTLLGRVQWEQGEVDDSIQTYEHCAERVPTCFGPLQNKLLALNYMDNVTLDHMFQAYSNWGQRAVTEMCPVFNDKPCLPRLGERLRLGYTSPDFCDTSVAAFTKCLLTHHDREKFDVFVYSSSIRHDATTELFQSTVPSSHWRDVAHMRASDIAEQIRQDGICELVDLANHAAENRLDVMALKPAPVQFTYAGILNTTGLATIDYSVTDHIVDPPDSTQMFSEQLAYLPGCFLCYTPPAHVPALAWKGVREGRVTFGSFSALGKVSSSCVELWARVLREVPSSRLLVKCHGLGSSDVRAKFTKRFEAHGIEADRLDLVGFSPQLETLALYNDVDIALDTCPFSNVTTTCEALLMGVPTISLRGETRASRAGATLLRAVGLEHCVASGRDEYVHKARLLAEDVASLASLRGSLREIFLSSPLCDGPGFMRQSFEPMLLERWQRYCAQHAAD